jgi:hypothetical protein
MVAALAPTSSGATQESSPAAGPQPVAVVSETIFDFGVIARGSTQRHTFAIENQGDAPLEILRFRSTCPCTLGTYDETILPGATGKVEIILDATTIEGPGQGNATIITNDPKNPSITFVLKTTSKSSVGIEPSAFRFTAHQYFDGEGAIAATLYSLDGKDFSITDAVSPSSSIEVEVREATQQERKLGRPGQQYRLIARLSSDAPVGPLSGFIRLSFDHPAQSASVIPVSGFVRPVMAATPPTMDLGQFALGASREVSFHIQHFTDWEVEITEITINLPGVETSVRPGKTEREFYGVLTFTPQVPKGPFRAVATIVTTAKTGATLEVPITGTVVEETAAN